MRIDELYHLPLVSQNNAFLGLEGTVSYFYPVPRVVIGAIENKGDVFSRRRRGFCEVKAIQDQSRVVNEEIVVT